MGLIPLGERSIAFQAALSLLIPLLPMLILRHLVFDCRLQQIPRTLLEQ